MSTPAVFDYAVWAQQFPKLAGVIDQTVGQMYFNLACGVVDNTDCSPIDNDAPTYSRTQILYLIVSHLVTLFNGDGSKDANGNPVGPSGLVGRIESATEGTVSVSTGQLVGNLPASANFYTQSQYGLLAWTLLGVYRMARYIPGPPVQTLPGRLGFPYYSGYGVPGRRC